MDPIATENLDTLEKIRQVFARDRFATQCAGVVVEVANPPAPGDKTGVASRVVCSMTLDERHRNAYGGIMGGAIFTLADFVFAIASNAYSPKLGTVAISASASYLAGSRGTRLIASGRCLRAGRTTIFYAVDVTDDLGVAIASMSFVGHRSPIG